jgi:cytidylate kinase
MTGPRSVVFNGDLGSGKTTVSVLVARKLGIRRISIGDLYREMAAQRGLTALQLNLRSELDDKIDHHVDQLQHDIAASGERLVVDSRLAWHFFADALKVHLITDRTVAARRVLGRPGDAVETYAGLDEARSHLAIRSESERMRFLSRYGVDKTRLRNYDLVCDTTSATPDQVAAKIVEMLDHPAAAGSTPACHLDPRRVYPTEDPADDDRATPPIVVGYRVPHFFAVSGHRALSAAVHAGRKLVPMSFAGEADERIDGRPCAEHFARVTSRAIRSWESEHRIELPAITRQQAPAA